MSRVSPALLLFLEFPLFFFTDIVPCSSNSFLYLFFSSSFFLSSLEKDNQSLPSSLLPPQAFVQLTASFLENLQNMNIEGWGCFQLLE